MGEARHEQTGTVAVIGGGPAGLMAAEVLSQAGLRVDLFDSMPSVGRKFLVAGKGGLNLTHSEPREQFLARYGSRRAELEPFLLRFGADELRQWAAELGIETFTGTSGRVFPIGMKAAPLLYAWRQRLTRSGVTFHQRHKWLGWNADQSLRFETPSGEIRWQPRSVILALGGGSWARLGSTGEWTRLLAERGVALAPFRPSNCGFDLNWSEHFRTRFDGQPLKAVILEVITAEKTSLRRQGEFIITSGGVEGSLIYALSAPIRDEIERLGSATVYLDLAPDRTLEYLVERLSLPRGSRSISNHLEKSLGLRGVKAGLLWEFVVRADFNDPQKLAQAIKKLPLPLIAARPLDEAISSAGGICFEALDENLMLKNLPGVFCAGEMLDWEAPTGGYLITACCATGRAAGSGALQWLENAAQA
jgi:uncharacterized flavoprotein (TIGR03862 family)